MKILFDNQIFQIQKFGGINRYFDELMKMEEHGVETDMVSSMEKINPAPSNQDFYSKGVRYLKRKISKNIPASQSTIQYLNKFLEKEFDIFHPTYYNTYFFDYINKPFVLTVYDMIHEIFSEYMHFSDETSRFKRQLCNKAATIIAISDSTKQDLVDIYKLPEEKIHTIHLASDFDKVPLVAPANAHLFNNFILFVGNRGTYKNFYYPTYAIADLLKADRSLQFLCTGHPFTQEERNLFKDLDIADQIHQIYLKNDNELAWAYSNAKLFIFPSLYEGFGFPLLEAFASNCPVVSSTGGSLKEVGGDAPLYIDAKNINDMRDKIYEALYNNVTRVEMIKRGNNQFKKFSWDITRQKTLQVYKSALL